MKKLLTNSKIKLTYFLPEDEDKFLNWYADEELMRLFDAIPVKPKTMSDVKKWLTESSNDVYRFAIRKIDNNNLVGFIELNGLLWNHRVSWISLFIGDKDNRGKGFGKEAMNCIVNYAFSELNLRRLQLSVFSYNEQAIGLYEKLGFKREGTYREFLERDGLKYDMYLYGLLKHEWKG